MMPIWYYFWSHPILGHNDSELSTSILLYNVKTRTMTVAIYTEVLRGNYGVAAALSTILTVLTVGSLLLFMKISKSNSITL